MSKKISVVLLILLSSALAAGQQAVFSARTHSSGSASPSVLQDAPLGATYTMIEGSWSGDCKNVNANIYRCYMENYKDGDKTVYSAKVELNGSSVLIRRGTSTTDFNSCLYRGRLDSSGHIEGTYGCKNTGDATLKWEAFVKK